MKRNRHALAILVLAIAMQASCSPVRAQKAPPETSPSPAGETLDLNDCYRLALAMSERDLLRGEEIRQAESRYNRSLGALFPEVGLFASKNWQDRIDYDRDPLRDPGAVTKSLLAGNLGFLYERTPSPNPFLAGARVRLPLFNGFRIYRESQSLSFDVRARRLERARFRELLYRDTAEIFYQIIQYEKSLQILADEEEALRGRIAELGRLVRLGRSRPGDLLAARFERSSNLVERELVKGLHATSKELLAFLIGRAADRIRLRDTQTLPADVNLETYLRIVGERKDVLAALESVRSARQSLSAAGAGHYPDVSLEGNYLGIQRPDTRRDWNVSLRIDMPIFEGGRASAEISEAAARLRSSELELQRLRRSVDNEVRMAYNDFISTMTRILLLREAVALSQAAHAAQQRDYRHGIVRNLEVLEALRRLHQARRQLALAETTARLALVRLHVAAGRKTP